MVVSATRRFGRLSRSLGRSSVALLVFAACDSIGIDPERPVSLTLQAGSDQAGEVGTTLAGPLVVEVHDHAGVPVKGALVRFESDAVGTLPRSSQSDSLGRAWVWWQLGETVGTQLIRAYAPNAPQPVTFSAHGLPGPPGQVVVVKGLNIVAVAGAEVDTLTVLVTDRFRNTVLVAEVNWSIESGNGTIRPLSARTDAKGHAKALWKLGPETGTQSLIVTAGTATRRITATPVPAFVAQQVVAGSDHSCALTADGRAHCWGSNAFGQLGIGARDWDMHRLPAPVATSARFKSLTAGAVHTCGLALDGATWCWGDNRGQQVSSLLEDVLATPTWLSQAPKFSSVVAGGFHTCGLTSGGVAYCWGDDSVGQLGRGSNRSTAEWHLTFGHGTPMAVSGSLLFKSIATSWTSTCGVTTSGMSYCWGENANRFLGSEVQLKCHLVVLDPWDEAVVFESACSTSPLAVPTRASVTALAVDQHGVCALLATSELECWGRGLPGPTLVPGARLSTVWASENATCGLNADDTVTCYWAYPPFNEVKPHGELTLVNISTSGRHTCGLTRGNEPIAYCWGTNYSGEVGDGTTITRSLPVAVVWPYGTLSNR